MKKTIFYLSLCVMMGILVANPADAKSAPKKEAILAMCRPSVSQIQNIEEIFEKDVLTVKRLKLICIYQENEETDYKPSFEYVKTRQLDWITFRAVTGKVALNQLFQENIWTPQFREIFQNTDGIIFTGGMDIPPVIYGQEQSLLTEATTPVRSYYEISFLFHLVGGSQNPNWTPLLESRKNYPVLAICLGAQSLNVAAGGTMIQDIPSQLYGLSTVEQVLKQEGDRIHSNRYDDDLSPNSQQLSPHFHRIRFLKESFFCKRLGMTPEKNPLVLSAHHQAIDKLGKDLWVSAQSLDGKITETVEHRRYPNVVGVQFHPEPYSLYRKGLWFRVTPAAETDRNLREYLENDGISFEFHLKLWNWFGKVLQQKE